jgi:hypothetical protein
MLVHWIWLSTRKELKGQVIKAVLQYFGDPETAYHARMVPDTQLK